MWSDIYFSAAGQQFTSSVVNARYCCLFQLCGKGKLIEKAKVLMLPEVLHIKDMLRFFRQLLRIFKCLSTVWKSSQSINAFSDYIYATAGFVLTLYLLTFVRKLGRCGWVWGKYSKIKHIHIYYKISTRTHWAHVSHAKKKKKKSPRPYFYGSI